MASICSECGALKVSKEESSLILPVTTPWTLARCQQLAKSNEPPNSAEMEFMRAVVTKTAARLACLDDQISQLKERLEQLETERTQLSVYHSQNVPIISPLRRLPPEVLAQIFIWVSPIGNGKQSDIRRVWGLGQVCNRWRAIALSTSSLWSLVYITNKRTADPLRMIRTQVERARTLQIHFFGSEEADSTTQLELFKFLSEHSHRWEDLNIQLTAVLVPCLAALRGRLPLLRRLWIQWDKAKSQEGVDSISCFETASSLLDVGTISTFGFVSVRVPAGQLTSYRLQGPWKMHQRLLKMAPNIVEARVALNSNGETWPEPGDQTILLPRLQRLYVSNAKVLDYLQAPALSELSVWSTRPQTLPDILTAFLLRSLCDMRRLCLRGTYTANIMAEILKKHPSITHLLLAFTSGDAGALDAHSAMLTLGNAPAVSPHLTEICFRSTKWAQIDYPLFLKMLQSRRESPHCALSAASFVARDGPDPDPVTLAGLELLRSGGLSLSVESGLKTEERMPSWTYNSPLHFV